jgi:putative transposase
MERLGFSLKPVRRSTLSDANEVRPLGILEDCYKYLLGKVTMLAPHRKKGFRFHGEVLAIDSSVIQLCLSLSPWARYLHGHGGVKLHTAIDIANDLPQFAVITEARASDLSVVDNYGRYHGLLKEWDELRAGSTAVFDKAYMGYNYLDQLNKRGVYFVTRAKANCRFKVVESREVDRTRGLRCDQTVYANTRFGRKYHGKLRRVSYRDVETGNHYVFLTNRFDLAAKTICDLYKARWKVEVFFKTLKQNLRVKKFLGTSVNAVKAQIMVALIAYLLVQLIRYGFRTSISIPDTMAVIGTMVLLRASLAMILGELPRVSRYPPDAQLVLNI